jgi:hypothetical protein
MVKGFRGDDLRRVVNKITSDKDVWLKTMLTEELGINLEILGSPLKGALVMFGAFLLGVSSLFYHTLLLKLEYIYRGGILPFYR